jgi:rhodanese-related sulfurtransferase
MKLNLNQNAFIIALLWGMATVTVAQEAPKLASLEEFSTKLSQQEKPQIIDARSPEEFALNHLPGAVNFNLQTTNYAALVKNLEVTKPVFVYSIQNGRSSALAKDLRSRGFKDVYDLEKGIGNWVGGGKPLYTTAKKGLSLAEYNQILASNKLVLVDIGSRYCGSCRRVKPILETLRQEQGEALKIVELGLEEDPELIAALKTVTAFPYLILYQQGEIVWQRSGVTDLKSDIDTALAKTQ